MTFWKKRPAGVLGTTLSVEELEARVDKERQENYHLIGLQIDNAYSWGNTVWALYQRDIEKGMSKAAYGLNEPGLVPTAIELVLKFVADLLETEDYDRANRLLCQSVFLMDDLPLLAHRDAPRQLSARYFSLNREHLLSGDSRRVEAAIAMSARTRGGARIQKETKDFGLEMATVLEDAGNLDLSERLLSRMALYSGDHHQDIGDRWMRAITIMQSQNPEKAAERVGAAIAEDTFGQGRTPYLRELGMKMMQQAFGAGAVSASPAQELVSS